MIRTQQNRKALGSEAFLTIVSDKSEAELNKIFNKLWLEIENFEIRFSRFKNDSELTNFNSIAGKKIKVSKQFLGLLKSAKKYSIKTDGIYNPLILPTLQKVGYLGSWPEVGKLEQGSDFSSREIMPANLIKIGSDWAMIPANSALDFGGIGKGYLLDIISKQLVKKEKGFWLSLGGDIFCWGSDVNEKPWEIGIQSASNLNKKVGVISNHNKQIGIATSGVIKRKGVSDGHEWHHIIDPRTNKPAETDLLSVTVVCSKAVDADIYSKCLLILGSEQAHSYINKFPIQSAVIQKEDSNILYYGEINKT